MASTMCGRYAVYSNIKTIFDLLKVSQFEKFDISFNVAPTDKVPVICEPLGQNKNLVNMRWGLIPNWTKNLKSSPLMINARAETITEKPSFKEGIIKKRCLLPANGFFEWKLENGIKQPYYIHLKTDEIFFFGGIWESFLFEDNLITSCAIITLEANELLQPFHNRMPLIITADKFSNWLDPSFQNQEEILNMMRPTLSNDLEVYPVTPKMNKPEFNNSECVEIINLPNK